MFKYLNVHVASAVNEEPYDLRHIVLHGDV